VSRRAFVCPARALFSTQAAASGGRQIDARSAVVAGARRTSPPSPGGPAPRGQGKESRTEGRRRPSAGVAELRLACPPPLPSHAAGAALGRPRRFLPAARRAGSL